MRSFLTAKWQSLAMLNYVVEPQLLEPFVPRGTELDSFGGRTFISLVGFLFADTRVLGIPVPAHETFEEVNLRFYVRRHVGNEARRGVTFIRELVPRAIVAGVARLAYNEPYRSVPMRHITDWTDGDPRPRRLQYEWRINDTWSGLELETDGLTPGQLTSPGSEEEFITEHYWGYTRQRDRSTVEYRVEHPKWRVWSAKSARVYGDFAATYGDDFAKVLAQHPTSAFIADGSPISVGWPASLNG